MTYIEPVEVQEEQEPQEAVEEGIEASTAVVGSVGGNDAGRVQDLEWEPVESEQEPSTSPSVRHRLGNE